MEVESMEENWGGIGERVWGKTKIETALVNNWKSLGRVKKLHQNSYGCIRIG